MQMLLDKSNRLVIANILIIQHFGRFPHRNEVLGRTPTPEERACLDDGGARFGQ